MKLCGLKGCGGLAEGRAKIWQRPLTESGSKHGRRGAPREDVRRLEEALDRASEELGKIVQRLQEEGRTEDSLIIQFQQMLLVDPEIVRAVKEGILEDELAAEDAFVRVMRQQISNLTGEGPNSDSEDYFAGRVSDYQDLMRRVLRVFRGQPTSLPRLREPCVLVTDELTPTEAIYILDTGMVRGLVLGRGGGTSHSVLIATSRSIPTLVGLGDDIKIIHNGDYLLLDGDACEICLNPTKEEMAIFEGRGKDRRSRYRILESLKDLPPVTADGARIQLKVNIASPEELDESLILGIDGIGIWRTEFLFMEREWEPNEEEQAGIYRSVSEKLPDKWVDIRTLDIGSDKHLPYHPPVREPNPSLGVRGIRFGLAHRNLLKTQLKAILRANLGGNLRVILPMVTMVEEVRLVREMIGHCMGELEKEGHSFNPQLPLGIMVEVPSTAYALDLFLPVSDFFSLGTNDLIQYFLGADRQSESLQDLLSPFHPSIVRFLRDIADASLKAGKPMSICGEMASQTLAVPLLIGLGFKQLSVPPPMFTEIKGLIRRLDRSRCHQVAEEVCALSEREEAKALLLEFLNNS